MEVWGWILLIIFIIAVLTAIVWGAKKSARFCGFLIGAFVYGVITTVLAALGVAGGIVTVIVGGACIWMSIGIGNALANKRELKELAKKREESKRQWEEEQAQKKRPSLEDLDIPDHPVKPIAAEIDVLIFCPICNEKQLSTRTECSYCGVKFELHKDEFQQAESADISDAPPIEEQPVEEAQTEIVVPDHPVVPLATDDVESIVCPVCGEKQRAGRTVCWNCEVKFERQNQ